MLRVRSTRASLPGAGRSLLNAGPSASVVGFAFHGRLTELFDVVRLVRVVAAARGLGGRWLRVDLARLLLGCLVGLRGLVVPPLREGVHESHRACSSAWLACLASECPTGAVSQGRGASAQLNGR